MKAETFVKMFKELNYLGGLEQQVNGFIKDKKIIDIKYQVTGNDRDVLYSAMVMYEDVEK